MYVSFLSLFKGALVWRFIVLQPKPLINFVGPTGRTFAGLCVIFWNWPTHFETDALAPQNLLRSLNSLLPDDVAVHDCFPVRPYDHARYTAQFRYYQYRISRQKDPFQAGLVYVFTRPIDVERMNETAKCLLHHTCFESFSKVKTDVRTFNCRIEAARWEARPNGYLTFHIRADRFLRGRFRATVGTLLAVGQGRLSVAEFDGIIRANDRRRAGRAAPAEGLSLMEVGYPTAVFAQRQNPTGVGRV